MQFRENVYCKLNKNHIIQCYGQNTEVLNVNPFGRLEWLLLFAGLKAKIMRPLRIVLILRLREMAP